MNRETHIYGLVLCCLASACVEELDIEVLGVGGEEAGMLVVEGIFTNELKTQSVFLSRSSFRLDLETDTLYNPIIPLGRGPRDSVDTESGAIVRLLGDNGLEFDFTEGDEGTYLSNQPFALEMGLGYALEIQTSNGREYVSDAIGLTGTSEITNLYAERAISETGVEGVAIYVDSEPTQGNPKNYRYTYEETYKIIAPFWQEDDFELTDYDPCALPVPTYNLEIVPREIQNRICYNTVFSSTIDQVSTVGTGAGIQRHMVRFIGRDNFIISHRYSILAKQQVQSADAYSFYETLNSFSQSENVFSQVQPGALNANAHRADGAEENVLGYVEAVTVSEQRLFFDYEDFFPGEELPPYAFGFDCNLLTAPESHASYCLSGPSGGNPCPQSIIEQIDLGLINYYSIYEEDLVPNAACPGPYIFVSNLCGDCTLLGDNVEPDFWVEE